MSSTIFINIATEDALSEAVVERVVAGTSSKIQIAQRYNGTGFGYLKRTIKGFNNASKGMPWLVLTDLDEYPCPQALIDDWLPSPKEPRLLFRVAVREVESWLLAHRNEFASFLGASASKIPQNPDTIRDPKALILQLAAKSARKEIRKAVPPASGTTARIGPGYNAALIDFVTTVWNAKIAAKSSPSLSRAISRLKELEQP